MVPGNTTSGLVLESMVLPALKKGGYSHEVQANIGTRIGEGWKLRNFYTGGGLEEHLEYANKVDIITLENFVARANQGRL